MAKGYAEGPAAEEAEARRDVLERGERSGYAVSVTPSDRLAVYGSTADEPDRHFLGWRDDLDPDALFASGKAWGLTVVRQADTG